MTIAMRCARLAGALLGLIAPLGAAPAFAGGEYPEIVVADPFGCFDYSVGYTSELDQERLISWQIDCSNVSWYACGLIADACILYPDACNPESCPFSATGQVQVDACLRDPARAGTVTVDYSTCGPGLFAETTILPWGSGCIDNSVCLLPGQYCDQPLGACAALGSCRQRPITCTTESDPVCGCDGQTYVNACLARMAGVSVASTGPCAPPPTPTPTPTPEPVQPVSIDIGPFGSGHRLQMGSHQRVLVAILGADDFNATRVDVQSLAFGPAGAPFVPSTRSEATPLPAIRDIDDDGHLDLIARFDMSEAGLESTDAQACLSGETIDGQPFAGCDDVSVADR